LEKKCGFFESIGTVGNNKPEYIVLVQPIVTPLYQSLPMGKLHIFAINIANLFLNKGDPPGV
jgi:hypothetical protein